MNLGDGKRFKGGSTECLMCGNEKEDLQHFVLHCPYQEDEDQVIGRILFENENTNIENTKETITKFWHKREKRRKELP